MWALFSDNAELKHPHVRIGPALTSVPRDLRSHVQGSLNMPVCAHFLSNFFPEPVKRLHVVSKSQLIGTLERKLARSGHAKLSAKEKHSILVLTKGNQPSENPDLILPIPQMQEQQQKQDDHLALHFAEIRPQVQNVRNDELRG